MKKALSLLLAATICFCVVFSSCKKNSADSASDIAVSDAAAAQDEYNLESEVAEEEGTTSASSEESKTSETEQTTQDNTTTAAKTSEKAQNNKTSTTVKTTLSKTSSAVLTDPKPTMQDFKTLEKILNWDGGNITYADPTYFNYKTASSEEFIVVAESKGFVPAYRVYVDENMFNINNFIDIDNDGYEDVCISLKGFNWVLKNIYNYSGAEISSSNPCGCNIKGDNIYFWIPPDEGGVYGEFKYKNHTVNDNVYKVKFDFNECEYGQELDSIIDAAYTVTAAFKTVRNASNTGNINVWSIYSIEQTENYFGRG